MPSSSSPSGRSSAAPISARSRRSSRPRRSSTGAISTIRWYSRASASSTFPSGEQHRYLEGPGARGGRRDAGPVLVRGGVAHFSRGARAGGSDFEGGSKAGRRRERGLELQGARRAHPAALRGRARRAGPRAGEAAEENGHRREPAPRRRPAHHAEAARHRPPPAAAAHRFREAAFARGARERVLIDPKGDDYSRYKGASVLTPNLAELRDVVGSWKDEKDLRSRAIALRDKLGLEALLLTRGEDGMPLFAGRKISSVKAEKREVMDVTGAGDTVIATLAVMLGAGAGMEAAMRIANRAAGIVVGKLGTAAASHAELFPRIRK